MGPAPSGSAPRTVGSYETYDAQVAYTGIRALKLAFGVKNILDRDPPYTLAGSSRRDTT